MISNTKFAVLAAAILSSLSSALFTPLSTSKDLASLSANFTNDADVEIFDRTTTKRSNRGPMFCWPKWRGQVLGNEFGPVDDLRALGEGISYLKKKSNGKAICNVGAGPANCVRISCSYDTGIYICNDNHVGISPLCKDIATYAQDILDNCVWKDGYGENETGGQEFDSDGFNVIVTAESC